MVFLEYPKCTTCKNLKKELKENGVEFDERHIVEDNPTYDEIKKFHEKSGVDIKKFFNTSGMKYRELSLKDKLPTMSLEEKYELLSSDGMLVKRPLLITDDTVYVAKDMLKILN